MPKAVQYSANSVVYFSGEFDTKIFLLHSGRIALNSIDIENGSQVTENIKPGEFFGVKSALGNHPREENAVVLQQSMVYVFSAAEFEEFAQKNSRIIIQLLKGCSHRLRNIHRQLELKLGSKKAVNNEDGLFTVASAFYKSQHYQAAKQVAQRYGVLYPQGKHTASIESIIANSSQMQGKSFGVTQTCGDSEPVSSVERPSSGDDSDTVTLNFQLAQNFIKQENWKEAYKQFHAIVEGEQGDIESAYIGAVYCLYKLREHTRCIQLATGFVTQYPKSLKLAEALMYMGLCYQFMNRLDKAMLFFDKALTMAGPLLIPKLKELQAACKGALNG